MHQYKNGLQIWKRTQLLGQFCILCLRIFSQLMLTIPTALNLLQLLLASSMQNRQKCYYQSKIYMIINMAILYILIYNILQRAGFSFTSDFYLVQNFHDSYRTWGYAVQIVFRLFTEITSWRIYQFCLYYSRIIQRAQRNQVQSNI